MYGSGVQDFALGVERNGQQTLKKEIRIPPFCLIGTIFLNVLFAYCQCHSIGIFCILLFQLFLLIRKSNCIEMQIKFYFIAFIQSYQLKLEKLKNDNSETYIYIFDWTNCSWVTSCRPYISLCLPLTLYRFQSNVIYTLKHDSYQ